MAFQNQTSESNLLSNDTSLEDFIGQCRFEAVTDPVEMDEIIALIVINISCVHLLFYFFYFEEIINIILQISVK